MSKTNRRQFLQHTAALSASLAVHSQTSSTRAASANDRVRVGVVGLGGRARSHVSSLVELANDNVELAALCDCNEDKLEGVIESNRQKTGRVVTGYTDMRKLLDDDSIDAVTFATPNHWHSLCVIWACQAGKDAYVEKPGSHNIYEGRKMVEAARKYKRIVQHGTQCRSSPNIREGIQKLHEGIIGDVYMARGIAYKVRGNLGQHAKQPVPEGLDWSQWLGPAPLQDFSNFRHRRWHWIWDFGNGEIGNQGVHQFDIIRWGLKLDTHPTSVQAMGSNYMQEQVHKSSAETPGMLGCSMKFGDSGPLVEFAVRDWYTNGEAGFRDQYPFVQPNFPCGVMFLGTEGYMIFPDYSSYRTFFEATAEPGPYKFTEGAPMMDTDHFSNWISAVRSRNPEQLSAEIDAGHKGSALCHLANIAYRTERTLQFDPVAETFTGDEEANALLSREYREPYVVPDVV